MSRPTAGAQASVRRAGTSPRAKLAARVADRIVDDIVNLGWPEGEVLGSESELIARYGVSRAVFREAVRLVEHAGAARARRGPGGGLVVTAPSVTAVIDAVMVYLVYTEVRLDEVFEARLTVEETIAELVPGRLTEHGIALLRELVDDEATGRARDLRRLHLELAAMTRNPALELFVDIFTRVSNNYLGPMPQIARVTALHSAEVHARIVDAVVSGNEGVARRRMRSHLLAEADWVRRRRGARQVLDPELVRLSPEKSKRAELVAGAIFGDIASAGWPVGELLGSEPELVERYGVSRAVFREAVRLLEHHQIAKMRRGPGGGLFVTEPGVDAITEAVALYLERRGIVSSQLAEVRKGVELACVDLATARLDEAGIARLEQALQLERSSHEAEFSPAAHDLHVVIAEVTGNRVLALIVLVLARLSLLHHRDGRNRAPSPEVERDVIAIHESIVEAIVANDAQLARFRMRRHLDAMQAYLR